MSIYEEIGLRRVVNASGRMTALGVSTLSKEVIEAVREGGSSYVVIDELMTKAGEIISTYTGAEDSCPTSSASAGIAISVAAIISNGKKTIIEKLPDSRGLKNEVIIQKGHVVQFGAPVTSMIRLGGGEVVEVGMVNDVKEVDIVGNINEKTAAIIYVKSHHCVQKGMLSVEKMINLAHANNIPLIIDAAAEEDIKKYVALGADLVIYSGAKAIEATTSGFITGKKRYIINCHKQYSGIGRAMKIGKEGIAGLLKALELYVNKDVSKEISWMKEVNKYLIDQINEIDGLSATEIQDEAGREIYRCMVKVTSDQLDAKKIDTLLKAGNPSIHCRSHLLNQNILSFDPRPMVDGDKELIVNKLKEIMK